MVDEMPLEMTSPDSESVNSPARVQYQMASARSLIMRQFSGLRPQRSALNSMSHAPILPFCFCGDFFTKFEMPLEYEAAHAELCKSPLLYCTVLYRVLEAWIMYLIRRSGNLVIAHTNDIL